MRHISVLPKEIIDLINPNSKPGFKFIDGTAGAGGHIKAVLAANPSAQILGIDWDQTALSKLKDEFGSSGLASQVRLAHGNYAEMKQIAEEFEFGKADAILVDLGFSSDQIDDPERGFSFQQDGPLDMRYNAENKLTAEKVLNEYPETKLKTVFKDYGEENFGNLVARLIVQRRQTVSIASTDQVLVLIEEALPKPVKHKAKDVARRIFQAIRIEVNHELDNLKKLLPDAMDLLNPGGKLAVISFHSLEDRIVKRFFVDKAKGCVCPPDFPTCVCNKASDLKILTRKPVEAGEDETKINPRSRPAKLRVAQKL